MDIHGTVVLITGASAGIGRATALRFAGAGAKVALVARSAPRLAQLAEAVRAVGAEALALPADLRDPAQLAQAVTDTVRHYGRLDIVINNAGQAAVDTIAAINLDDFRQIMELNVYAPLLAMQAAVPVMRAQGGGIIVNVSSMVSKMRIPGLAAYAATKAALNMLSDTARVELAADHIRVISIFPRMTATDFSAHSLGNRAGHRRQHATAPIVDSPEFVADKILAAVVNEAEEQYMDV
ncbi:MAG TPA: SDR family oxidoreductase [Armatimonadota bacterium]